MARCLVSFGANLGNPLETIRAASVLLHERVLAEPETFRLSRFFRTPPVGGPTGQPPFVNAVAAFETSLSTAQVWQAVRYVEQELGRQRDRRWEARRIDLDILLYEAARVWSASLKVPHPRMCMRRFILIPAREVAAAWIDPVSQWSIERLASCLQRGPGSLLLLTEHIAHHTDWLPEIAQQTLAEIVPLGARPPEASRWITLAHVEQVAHYAAGCHSQSITPAKLVMVLAPPEIVASAVPGGGDWESQHQRLATSLRLLPESSANPAGVAWDDLPLGPRYLLSSDNRDWAIHEIVSALEAMDCPVEPLPDDQQLQAP